MCVCVIFHSFLAGIHNQVLHMNTCTHTHTHTHTHKTNKKAPPPTPTPTTKHNHTTASNIHHQYITPRESSPFDQSQREQSGQKQPIQSLGGLRSACSIIITPATGDTSITKDGIGDFQIRARERVQDFTAGTWRGQIVSDPVGMGARRT